MSSKPVKRFCMYLFCIQPSADNGEQRVLVVRVQLCEQSLDGHGCHLLAPRRVIVDHNKSKRGKEQSAVPQENFLNGRERKEEAMFDNRTDVVNVQCGWISLSCKVCRFYYFVYFYTPEGKSGRCMPASPALTPCPCLAHSAAVPPQTPGVVSASSPAGSPAGTSDRSAPHKNII